MRDDDYRASPQQLRKAREVFRHMLNSEVRESEWQKFFAENPFVFSRSLPLRLAPREITPLARPGLSEPDFIFFQKVRGILTAYGVIELKRPDSRILTMPRKDLILLTREADTAVKQAQKYAGAIMLSEQALFIGAPLHLFVIMGLTNEILSAFATEAATSQMSGLVPSGCQILPYDELLRRFEATLPKHIHILVPVTTDRKAQFEQIIVTTKHIKPEFLRFGGEYSPFDAFHPLKDSCPSCGNRTLYCCFSGPLGGGSSITEEYLHICIKCQFSEFKSTWYVYDGSDWADCICLLCRYQYGDILPKADEVRVRDLDK
jgi:hypothetical protein